MDLDEFSSAFAKLTSHAPFLWQRRLFYEHLAKGDVPPALDLPTGLGKTSVMAIWLIARACGARLPRRLIYVVDRRAVVDQATEEAETLRSGIGGVPGMEAALRLEGRRLPISTLRGRFVDNRAWTEDPSLPAIVVGTVDMIGSRLLFQGYNLSRRMSPIHAALLANDALIVLDEAHLVPPFHALLAQVKAFADEDRKRMAVEALKLHLMALSATSRGTNEDCFGLEEEDEREDSIVAKRLAARKRLKLEGISAVGDLAEVMAERAWERGDGGRRVIVFCNSRKVAQDVHDELEKRLQKQLRDSFGKNAPEIAAFLSLIVGARRAREREEVTRKGAFKRFAPKTAEEEKTKAAGMPAFLVATSAGEVGVDIDADHMVCDLVAWERMVQRLGRVNRQGDFTEGSLVDVFPATSDKDKEAETTIDADRIGRWRAPFESGNWNVGDDGRRDASPGMLRRLRDIPEFQASAKAAATPAPLRPLLTRAHVDAWSMSSLDRHPGRAEVAPWIRGWVEEEPQTQLLWRRLLPLRDGDSRDVAAEELRKFLEDAPPHSSELLETYSWDAAKLLRERAKAALKPKKARDRDKGETADGRPLGAHAWVAAILSPSGKVERLLQLAQATETEDAWLAGRVLLLDARLGGLDRAGLLNLKADRVPPVLDDPLPPEVTADESAESLWSAERLRQIGFRVRRAKHDERIQGWGTAYRRFVMASDEEDGGDDSAEEWRVEEWVAERPAAGDPALARAVQCLSEHHEMTEAKIRDMGGRLDLPVAEIELLAKAAAAHDLGKARRNWQAYAGNPAFARDPGKYPARAKFSEKGKPSLLKIGRLTYRHEFGPVRDVRPTLDGIEGDVRDFVLHLIAAHHGNARPLIAAADEKHLPDVSAELAREVSLRFAHLQKLWGPWGLAWWEALLRAADAAASRAFNEQAKAGTSAAGSVLEDG